MLQSSLPQALNRTLNTINAWQNKTIETTKCVLERDPHIFGLPWIATSLPLSSLIFDWSVNRSTIESPLLTSGKRVYRHLSYQCWTYFSQWIAYPSMIVSRDNESWTFINALENLQLKPLIKGADSLSRVILCKNRYICSLWIVARTSKKTFQKSGEAQVLIVPSHCNMCRMR